MKTVYKLFCLFHILTNLDTVCFYNEFSDASCTNQIQSYSLSMQNCMTGDADDDGYVMQADVGIIFFYQQFVAQQNFPAALPGTSTTLRFIANVLVPFVISL